MPALVKATWIFDGQSRGWTESLVKFFDVVAPGQVPDLKLCWNAAYTLAQKRQIMLSQEYRIKAIRVSTEIDGAGFKVIGDSVTDYVNMPGQGQTPGLAPNMAIQTIFRSQFGRYRKFIDLRGAWKINLGDGGQLTPDPTWRGYFNSWASSVSQNSWGWLGQDPISPTRAVVGYVQNLPAETVTLETSSDLTPLGFGRLYYARCRGINQGSELNTKMLVSIDDAHHFTTIFRYGVVPFQSNGFVTFYTNAVRLPTDWNIQKIMSRRAGAPLLEPRGRRPKRVRV